VDDTMFNLLATICEVLLILAGLAALTVMGVLDWKRYQNRKAGKAMKPEYIEGQKAPKTPV